MASPLPPLPLDFDFDYAMSVISLVSSSSLCVSTMVCVSFLLAANYAIYLGLGWLSPSSNQSTRRIWSDAGSRSRFSRYLVDFLAMLYFCAIGFLGLSEFDGSLTPGGSLYRIAVGGRSSHTHLLCLYQLSYEVKSLIDAFIQGDDLVYFGHHAATALMAYCSLNSGFCQVQPPSFHISLQLLLPTRQPKQKHENRREMLHFCSPLPHILFVILSVHLAQT
jgi:hypothetical protein